MTASGVSGTTLHRPRKFPWQLGILILAFIPIICRGALEDEIEVFNDALAIVGQTQTAIHVNTSPQGRTAPDFQGEVVPDKTLRVMAEIAYGVRDGLEVGLHLPFLIDKNGDLQAAGLRPRLRWIPVRPAPGSEGSFYGFNLEYSDVDRRFERPARHLEWKPIAGWRGTTWEAAINPGFTVWLSDTPKPNPEFSLNAMLKRRVSQENLVGLEFYSNYGPLGSFLPTTQRDRMVFLAGDFSVMNGYRINLGAGRGLTPHSDHSLIKAIVTLPY